MDGVDFHLEEGKTLGIAGESGCGKSTLALSLMGFYFPPLHYNTGSIRINGFDIMQLSKEKLRSLILGKEIAYIPQGAMNALNPTMKIIHFIEDILHEHQPELTNQQIWDLAAERFETLNLSTRVLNSYPNELSGGMKQRTVIAISTILNPKVLIADEPTSALDVTSQKSGKHITNMFGYGRNKTTAVVDVNFDFHEGEIISIVGESGSGKKTLAKIIMGLLNQSAGEIKYKGKP